MRKLTPQEQAEADRVLAEVAAEIPAGMSAREGQEYLVKNGYAREMSAEEVEARYGGNGHITLTFFGEAQQHIERGSIVAVQYPDGAWHNRMVAVGAEGNLIYVAVEDEWQAATREGREPLTVAYPKARVKLTDGE